MSDFHAHVVLVSSKCPVAQSVAFSFKSGIETNATVLQLPHMWQCSAISTGHLLITVNNNEYTNLEKYNTS